MATSVTFRDFLTRLAIGKSGVRHQQSFMTENKCFGPVQGATQNFGRPYCSIGVLNDAEPPLAMKCARTAAGAIAMPFQAVVKLGEYDAERTR